MGRGYHLIASCGRDGYLRVHKLLRTPSGSLEPERPATTLRTPYVVWRIEWYTTPHLIIVYIYDLPVHVDDSDEPRPFIGM